jgi:hypothetical protein
MRAAEAAGIRADALGSVLTVVIMLLITFGIVDLYDSSKSVAHAKTWLAAFEDAEKELATAGDARKPWTGSTRPLQSRPLRGLERD